MEILFYRVPKKKKANRHHAAAEINLLDNIFKTSRILKCRPNNCPNNFNYFLKSEKKPKKNFPRINKQFLASTFPVEDIKRTALYCKINNFLQHVNFPHSMNK